jgi:hypothetical protein
MASAPTRGCSGLKMMRFARFWWNFIVGDDWRVAAGLAAALVLTWLLRDQGVRAWWCLPLAVAVLLVGSVRRGAQADD